MFPFLSASVPFTAWSQTDFNVPVSCNYHLMLQRLLIPAASSLVAIFEILSYRGAMCKNATSLVFDFVLCKLPNNKYRAGYYSFMIVLFVKCTWWVIKESRWVSGENWGPQHINAPDLRLIQPWLGDLNFINIFYMLHMFCKVASLLSD